MIEIIANHPYITFYIFYSIAGYFFLSGYLLKCVIAKIPGFSGSLWTTIFMAVICGGITTSLLLWSLGTALWITYKEYKNPDQIKKEDDDIL